MTYDWLRQLAETLDEPTIPAELHARELDDMWHLIQSKTETSGSLQPWIMAQGELGPGCSVVVRLQPSSGSMTN